MNKLHLSDEAQKDLIEIKRYIAEELENPKAALAVVSRITKSIRILRDYLYAGPLLSSVAEVTGDYRFIVSGSYIVFYRVMAKVAYIDRILYGRQDYLRLLFPDVSDDENDSQNN